MDMNSPDTALKQQDTEDNKTWISHAVDNQSIDGIANNCRIFDNNTRIPWNHPGNLVSWQTEELFYTICSGLLIPLFFIFGTPANVLNMVVFYKQGLKERINFCLFFLAFIDILHLTPVFIYQAEHVNSWFTGQLRNGDIYRFVINNNLLGFYGFGYGSMLLVSIISTERCVCVLFPLRAQHCIPTKAFAIVVAFTVLTGSFMRFIFTAQNRSGFFYEVKTQRTSWQYVRNDDYYYKNESLLIILEGVFYGFVVSLGCPTLVLITTIITAIKLRQIVRWRSQTSSGMSSPKEIGITKMLICLSVEFIVLSSPLIIVRVSRLFPSVLNTDYHLNVHRILINCYEVCFYISSSVNFAVYYITGTKYRDTLHALLGIRKVDKKTDDSKKTRFASAQYVLLLLGHLPEEALHCCWATSVVFSDAFSMTPPTMPHSDDSNCSVTEPD
ncbi:hypothetical protein ACOMHN_047758 [Nucella lapillus]